MNLTNLINTAKNMVEIESIILSEVSRKYMNLFAQTERKFDRTKESQHDWLKAVDVKYKLQAERERKQLFSIIPERFHKSQMYLNLKERLTYRIVKAENSLLS